MHRALQEFERDQRDDGVRGEPEVAAQSVTKTHWWKRGTYSAHAPLYLHKVLQFTNAEMEFDVQAAHALRSKRLKCGVGDARVPSAGCYKKTAGEGRCAPARGGVVNACGDEVERRHARSDTCACDV
jgi:hypothetical protein